jgi:hypothetical protein
MQLAALLDEARQAPPDRRIQWRDRIAPYGPRAIEAIRPWLASPALAAFAVRVIERAGESGERELATRVLRAARREASPPIHADIDWALVRLRPLRLTSPVEPGKPAPTPARPERRERPFTIVARRRAR